MARSLAMWRAKIIIYAVLFQILVANVRAAEEPKPTEAAKPATSFFGSITSAAIPTAENRAKWMGAAGTMFDAAKKGVGTLVSNAVVDKCLSEFDDKYESLEKFHYLRKLQKTNQDEFYRCLNHNIEKMAPIVYMPVAGKASKNYNVIARDQLEMGITFNIEEHKGKIRDLLDEWLAKHTNTEVDVVLVTDGSRVLGLGDLGANSMAAIEGKMALYTALGGVHPNNCLSVTLDVGTDNEVLLGKKQQKYVGKPKKRVTDKAEYDDFIKEFVDAVVEVFGETTLIQLEGFSTTNAYEILKKYQGKYPVINDDIQGAAAVTVAGVLAAARLRKSTTSVTDSKVLIVGADSVYQSALGIGSIMVEANFKIGNIYMMDKNGLLTETNCPMTDESEKRFCQKVDAGKDTKDLEKIVEWLKPKVLIGVSGAKDLFTKGVLKNMKTANGNTAHIVMLECTAEESYVYAKGKLFTDSKIFDSDSEEDGTKGKLKGLYEKFLRQKQNFELVQCNDDYIIPGVGLGVILSQMKNVPNKVFAVAAETVATECIKKYDTKTKAIYPTIREWIDCSVSVAAAVVQYAFKNKGLSDLKDHPAEMNGWTLNEYKNYVKERQYKVGSQSFLKRKLRDFLKDECVKGVDAKTESLDKYIYLRKLQVEKEKEFYKCLIRNVEKMLPIIYTPIVGKACKNYKTVVDKGGSIGLTLSYKEDKRHIVERLKDWKAKHQPVVKAIVVTDGGRILGLGDLGANGMGIPVGKLALYTALGSIDPAVCLPVTLDVGTKTEELRGVKNHKYVGHDMDRIEGDEYFKFIDEFMVAVVEVYGRTTLIQFEDFANPTAYPLLEKYQNKYTVFNDDIQGTAAVAVAGILAAARFRNTNIDDAKVLFVGAGSAALGIGTLVVQAMTGGDTQKNREKVYMKDAYGLLTSDVCGFPEPFAESDRRREFCHSVKKERNVKDLDKIILWMEPNILIGVSGRPNLFTPDVLKNMAQVNTKVRPIIMPLSNPTSQSECTAEQAFKNAKGCFFASGSPFAPVYVDNEVLESLGHDITKTVGGKELKPAQCNNDNIFPGVALGIIIAEMTTVPQHVFFIAAETLANKCLQKKDFENGSLYPEPKHLRTCSVKVAAAVVKYAFTTKDLSALKNKPEGYETWPFTKYEEYVKSKQYHP